MDSKPGQSPWPSPWSLPKRFDGSFHNCFATFKNRLTDFAARHIANDTTNKCTYRVGNSRIKASASS